MAPSGHTIKAIEILPRTFRQGYRQPRFPEFRPAVMNFRASRLQGSDSMARMVVSDSCGWDCGAAKSTQRSRKTAHETPCCGCYPIFLEAAGSRCYTLWGLCPLVGCVRHLISNTHSFMSFTHCSINLYLCVTSVSSASLGSSPSINSSTPRRLNDDLFNP